MPAVNIAPYIRNQYFSDSGVPLSGGLLHCYEGGSAGGEGDRKTTYSNAAGTTENTNPIVLDAAGRAKIYLASGSYYFVLTTSTGTVVWSEDGVSTSTVTTSVNTVSDLVALVGGVTPIIRTLGRLSANDGGGWWYYWNSASTATDDGGMIIQPGSLPASGRWEGIVPSDRMVNIKIYGVANDGTTDDAAKIQKCNAYCVANSCTMLIDGMVYEASNVSITAKMAFTPSAKFKWGNFSPTLNVAIDSNDLTQHFTCTASYVPILNVNEIRYEWFGETYAAHPVSTAVIAAISGAKTKVLSGTITINGVDLAYSAGSFTCTLTGVAETVTATAYWNRIGNVISLKIPIMTGTSNTTDLGYSGIPTDISGLLNGSTNLAIIAISGATIKDNGSNITEHLNASITSGAIAIGKQTAFTNSGVKGNSMPLLLTYYYS